MGYSFNAGIIPAFEKKCKPPIYPTQIFPNVPKKNVAAVALRAVIAI